MKSSLLPLLLLGVLVSIIPSGRAFSQQSFSDGEGLGYLEALVDCPTTAKSSLLVYREKLASLSVYAVDSGNLEKRAEISTPDHVWKATAIGRGKGCKIAVAYGFGRKHLNAPLRVLLYDFSLRHPKTIFTRDTPRSQTADLRESDGALLLTFFTSKYDTSTGLLSKGVAGAWNFKELFSTRLGMFLAPSADVIFVGRLYRDEAEGTGELRAFIDSSWKGLPSFRGISSIATAQLDSDTPEEIIIGDGWHKNYAKMAEPRLSIVDCKSSLADCSLRRISTTKPQTRINRIFPISGGREDLVIAVGNLFVDAYCPKKDWKRTRIYEKRKPKNRFVNLDATVIENTSKALRLAVYDGNLKVVSVGPVCTP